MTGDAMLRQAPRLTLILLTAPVLAGLAGTIVPAFRDDLAGFRNLVAAPGFKSGLWLSIQTGLASTAGALLITVLILAGLYGSRAFATIQHLLAPLLAVPHAAAALGLAFLISPSGWIARVFSPWATGWEAPPDLLILNDPAGLSLTLGLIAKEVPFLLLMAIAVLPQVDAPRRLLVAQSLGAGRVAGFVIGVLPSLYRQLRLPVYAVLAYSMTAVDMAMILGPTLPHTLSVQIALWMTEPTLTQQSTAAAAAVVQLLAVLGALGTWRMTEVVARRLTLHLAEAGLRLPWVDKPARALGAMLGLLLAGLLFLALAGMALWSVAGLWGFPHSLPESLSFKTWLRSAPALMESGGITLRIALWSTLMALIAVLACLEAEHRFGLVPGARALWILYLPLLMPQVAFLPGVQWVLLRGGADGTWGAVAASHVIFVLPYVFLSLAPAYRGWDGRVAVAGATLGAAPWRVFLYLRLPMLLRPVLTAFAVGMAVSIGQYLPTLLIGGGRIETLTTEAVALSSGGNRRLIGAYALLQMLLPALFFGLALLIPTLVYRNRRALRVSI